MPNIFMFLCVRLLIYLPLLLFAQKKFWSVIPKVVSELFTITQH